MEYPANGTICGHRETWDSTGSNARFGGGSEITTLESSELPNGADQSIVVGRILRESGSIRPAVIAAQDRGPNPRFRLVLRWLLSGNIDAFALVQSRDV